MNTESGECTLEGYRLVRDKSRSICSPLEIEDYGVQSMPDVSPPKWHLAHTSWFFEQMLLVPFLEGYKVFHPGYAILFNSYYESLGTFHPRHQRGCLSRPTVREVSQYRDHVDEAMARLLAISDHGERAEIERRTILGLHHEQQHQELLLMDIKHIFASNPLRPAYTQKPEMSDCAPPPTDWIEVEAGLYETGFAEPGFAYDNEMPRHKTWLEGFRIATTLVTCGDFIAFMQAGGYRNADLWHSEARAIITAEGWNAPLYWEETGGEWRQMTLHGMQPVNPDAPVCHVSFYEASAYARWKNLRLPTESEWEVVASRYQVSDGIMAESQPEPCPETGDTPAFYNNVWQWTGSPYTEYPGYKRAEGALGEYNGKFMSNQMVLRGGASVTPQGHVRPTYRNFFPAHSRWQFSGIRLAGDLK